MGACPFWRVLRRYSPDSVVVGSPETVHGERRWWLGQLQLAYLDQEPDGPPAAPRPVVMMDPQPHPVRASRAERRRALELRWPSSGFPSSIEIVNRGSAPVELWSSELAVLAVVTGPGTAEFSFGYSDYGVLGETVTVPSGGSLLVPVRVITASGAALVPGSFELHPVLVDSGLLGEAVPLEVTSELIARLQG
ncbi:hypothetical protein [Herbiconiux flava]|uniref:Uncharacterized protein n=1 Tax=Herbiconiux flava TaxID=881268 RepID=A0A852STC8_9MICO|nr:hypothetical protein [Herbiconiux flava]NYD71900.1 hypothetical protein [Herbiconiux flava]GLK18137.1 hypothetical protein GCM10017602_26190 [Herbiconiux flava]